MQTQTEFLQHNTILTMTSLQSSVVCKGAILGHLGPLVLTISSAEPTVTRTLLQEKELQVGTVEFLADGCSVPQNTNSPWTIIYVLLRNLKMK